MTSRSKPRFRPGERRKTFTGCWTCRTRRVRCDEGRPACTQCISKNLKCGGYTTRLQWLPPQTDSGEQPCGFARTWSSQRRLVAANLPTSILGDAALEEELNAIDAEEPLSSSNTCIHGPFSIFRVEGFDPPHFVNFPDSASDGALPGALSSPTGPDDGEPCWPSNMDLANIALDSVCDNVNGAPGPLDGGSGAADIDFTWLNEQLSPSSAAFPSFLDLLADTDQYPGNSEAQKEYSLSTQMIGAETPIFTPDPSLTLYNLKPAFMTDENRFLLNHYVTTVVHIFSVVENYKSPWRTLHLPRALQGSGELEATGSTSNARNALLHAILSVSAYSLVNKYKMQGWDEPAKEWSKKAMHLRFRAVNLLKSCLEEDLSSSSKKTSQAKPKYKELLAAMLSMISIDVVSGDTRTCRLHLKGCESLIRFAKKGWKTKYSSKARALHRIFYFLRAIHASTSFHSQGKPSSKEPSTPTIPGEEQQDELSSDFEEAESWLEMDQKTSSVNDMSSCEFIYGIPQDLLLLMGKTTEIVQQVNLLGRKQWDLFLTPQLAAACDKLEADVLDWPIDTVLSSLSRGPVGPQTRAIIEHQTRAFHNALIIYFSRHIRLMHRRHLQRYVENVIVNLEAIEKIKEDSGLIAGPMTWQCFIAACEALDEPLQQRFLWWFDRTRSYGMEAGSKGREVVVEVWNQRRLGGSDITTDWRKIAEAKEAYLMLT